MTFRDALDKHLQAIHQRNLPALIDTLPFDRITLVMADGRLVQTVQEFIQLHHAWFKQPTWTLATRIVNLEEGDDLGVATIHLEYCDVRSDGSPLCESSYLTLVFARQRQRWVMILDQNTPIKATGS